MGLKKTIELNNGVILNYHRITSFNKITNISNNIEVSSYTSREKRNIEKQYQEMQIKLLNKEPLEYNEEETLRNGIDVYIETTMLQISYNENMTIKDAYEYLKTTEKFKDAIDV